MIPNSLGIKAPPTSHWQRLYSSKTSPRSDKVSASLFFQTKENASKVKDPAAAHIDEYEDAGTILVRD